MFTRTLTMAFALFGLASAAAQAQDRGTMEPRRLPPLANPSDPHLPAKQVFGRMTEPSVGAPHVYGFYSHGCIAGAQPLPHDGPTWQVMRPSRDRNWGHPVTVAYVERLAERVRQTTHLPGILIGDMAQPRGGPMLGGHASHQIGLDVDIWFRPMPDRRLSREEREFSNSTMVVREDRKDVDPKLFTTDTLGVLKAAAQDPHVQRIFVNAAIKKAVCRMATGDRSWLGRIQPWYHHDYHFHVRLYCPPGDAGCQPQAESRRGEGCDASLNHWFLPQILHPTPPKKPAPPRPPMTMAAMSEACRAVAAAPGQQVDAR